MYLAWASWEEEENVRCLGPENPQRRVSLSPENWNGKILLNAPFWKITRWFWSTLWGWDWQLGALECFGKFLVSPTESHSQLVSKLCMSPQTELFIQFQRETSLIWQIDIPIDNWVSMLNKILAKMGTAEGCRGKFGESQLESCSWNPSLALFDNFDNWNARHCFDLLVNSKYERQLRFLL